MTTYESNAAALDAALEDVDTWATLLDPADVRRTIEAHLLGSLMAEVDPATFAAALSRAEQFAGQPVDYREHGPL